MLEERKMTTLQKVWQLSPSDGHGAPYAKHSQGFTSRLMEAGDPTIQLHDGRRTRSFVRHFEIKSNSVLLSFLFDRCG